MKPAPFQYHRARDVDGAGRLLAELGDDVKVIAGGQSLVAMMNYRLARPRHLVDIGGLRELDRMHRDADGGLRIGALTTHHTVETDPDGVLGAGFEVLNRAMTWIGHLPIRTRGTVGGSMAHGDATAEWCLLAMTLGAEFVARGPRGERVIPAGDFFLGYYTTALDPDEILVEIVFPDPRRTLRSPNSPNGAGTSPSWPPPSTSMWRTARCAGAGWHSVGWRPLPSACRRRRPYWATAAPSRPARRLRRRPWSRPPTRRAVRTTARNSYGPWSGAPARRPCPHERTEVGG